MSPLEAIACVVAVFAMIALVTWLSRLLYTAVKFWIILVLLMLIIHRSIPNE